MSELSKKKRLEIYRVIKDLGDIWGYSQQDNWNRNVNPVEFLERIWDLRLMSSLDPRFRNAAEDARQHLINNEDWDDDYTFLDRFRLIDGQEEDFIRFVNVVISPDVRQDKQEIDKYINAIEKVLPKGYNFHEVIDGSGNKKIELSTKKKHDEYEYPVNLPHNAIKFYVDRRPDTFPAFCLTSNTWDDFGYKTTFELSYTSNGDRSHSLGKIKIFKEGVLTTMECIPDVFTTLPDSFCSLMQSKAGYRKLKRLRPNDYASVLFGSVIQLIILKLGIDLRQFIVLNLRCCAITKVLTPYQT